MTVHDLWYLKTRDPGTKKPLPSKRHGRGMRWRVTWPDPNNPGKELSEHFDKKTAAEAKNKTVGADILRGDYLDPKAGRITVAGYARAWRGRQIHDVVTAEDLDDFFRLHVDDEPLGKQAIADVRTSHVQAWVKGRTEVLGAGTIRAKYVYVKALFATAADDGVRGASPCGRVKLPESDAADRYIPTPAEVHALAGAVNPRHKAIPLIAAGCGLRPSEVFGLERKHINFLKRTIRVEQQTKRSKEHGTYVGNPKTKTSTRTVEMPQGVFDALVVHLAKFPPVSVPMLDRRDLRKPVTRDVELLFVSATKLPIYGVLWTQTWTRAVKKAKLPKGFGLHGLRHYFATLLIHNGKSVKTVQLALGHATPMVTLNTYTHEWPDGQDRTRDIVDAVLFGDDGEATDAAAN